MSSNTPRGFALVLGITLALTSIAEPPAAYTQGASRTFPETGKTVSGRFLDYWNTHGGLAQQGFPISDQMQETSDTNGQTYTVQYFERAVFELHPENQPPNDVLLSLLGVFLYNQKYPNGAPIQQANSSPGSVLFQQTGHRVGGRFLQYWQQHGGLAQQGYPISDEFQEKSDLDGQTYTMQYFERAVFEWHPENRPPFDVLLSQLGTFRLRARYASYPVPTPPVAGCASPIYPGAWQGPIEWSYTVRGQSITGAGGGKATALLNVDCNGTFTGTATTTDYQAQITTAGATLLTCGVLTQPTIEFAGALQARPTGLYLAISGGHITRGAIQCRTALGRSQTQDLTGRPINATDIRADTVTPTSIGGNQWAPDAAYEILVEQLTTTFGQKNLTTQNSGHWQLDLQDSNTP